MSQRFDRRTVLQGMGALGLGTLIGCSGDGDSSAPAGEKPNVLFITVDDLGTTLGAYGHPKVKTPRIDKFASQAALFEWCWCQMAICTASRTSILTGLRPETTGLVGIDHDWQATLPDAVSMVRHFRDNGYRTFGAGKIRDPRGGAHDDAWDERVKEGGIREVGLALDMLDEATADDGPFFVGIGFEQAHCPWEPSAEALAAYDGPVEPDGPGVTMQQYQVECAGVAGQDMSTDEVNDLMLRYLASVTEVDTMIGQVLDRAANLKLFENTIVIVWSGDHGYSLGQHDWWGKWTNHKSSTHIPLIMHVPGVSKPGQRISGIVEAVDMYPTLVDLCGLTEVPQSFDGLSFGPLFAEPERAWKKAAFSSWEGQLSVKTDRYNLVEPRFPFFQVYDLIDDPYETTNLAEGDPQLVEELVAILEAGPSAALPS